MDKMINRVQDVVNVPYSLVNLAVSNQPLQRAMSTNRANLRNESDTYQFLFSLLETNEFVNGVSCATQPGLFGEVGVPQRPNTTFITSYRLVDTGRPIALYMDWSSAGYLMQMNFSTETKTFTAPFSAYGPEFVWAEALPMFAFFTDLVSNIKSVVPRTSISFNQGVMITGFNMVYFPPGADKATLACSIGIENEKALGRLFADINVTPNSRVLMVDINTGKLLANSAPNAVFKVLNAANPLMPVEHFDLTTTNDTVAKNIGSTLTRLYGNYTKVPRAGTNNEVDIGDGQKWFLNARYLNQPSNWLIIVAIPRADFFSETDSATRKALILAGSVAAGGILIAVIAAVLLVRPLYKLSKAMEMLTNLDFSALEGNILKERSFVTEVRNLQITFSTMCKAFASGIRRNRALAAGYSTKGQSTTVH
ncbi:hypothetical protein HDU96_008056 [Phlyctochytrium bullatum]|nr:hypothetical protein HDU96_008056 [Phlyctochytrium bullatum]